MEMPFGGTESSDTFETGTIAAAWGGVTTIVDFAVQNTGGNVQEALAKWHRKADGNCAIDYAFHQIIGGVDDQSLKAMRYLVDHEGITSFKLFMAYPGVLYSDDGQILRGDADRRRRRGDDHDARRERHRHRRARPAGAGPRRHRSRGSTATPGRRRWRPRPPTGRSCSATSPATCRCTSCTCRPATRSPRSPRRATHGRNVFAETCPQYLWLTLEETLGQPGLRGRQVGVQHAAALQGPRPRLHRADGPRPPGRPVEAACG